MRTHECMWCNAVAHLVQRQWPKSLPPPPRLPGMTYPPVIWVCKTCAGQCDHVTAVGADPEVDRRSVHQLGSAALVLLVGSLALVGVAVCLMLARYS